MNAVETFKIVQGEWLFQKLLQHMELTEEEFTEKYEKELDKDCTCLNDVIVEMMFKKIRRK